MDVNFEVLADCVQGSPHAFFKTREVMESSYIWFQSWNMEMNCWGHHHLSEHPQSNGVVWPSPILILHYKHMPLIYISCEGVGAGSGSRSAMKTIGNRFSDWKNTFSHFKVFTRIRTRDLIVFGHDIIYGRSSNRFF